VQVQACAGGDRSAPGLPDGDQGPLRALAAPGALLRAVLAGHSPTLAAARLSLPAPQVACKMSVPQSRNANVLAEL
jgi:hypothetical protein